MSNFIMFCAGLMLGLGIVMLLELAFGLWVFFSLLGVVLLILSHTIDREERGEVKEE